MEIDVRWKKGHIERRESNKAKCTTKEWNNDRADNIADKIYAVYG